MKYSNIPKYWNRFANSEEPDQMQQNIVWITYSNNLDTSKGSRMDYFKFYDKYAKLRRYLKGKYGRCLCQTLYLFQVHI